MQLNLEAMKEQHVREIGVVQKEIYQQTLNDVAKEFHDNLGSILAAIKIELTIALEKAHVDDQGQLQHIQLLMQTFTDDFRKITKNLINYNKDKIDLKQEIEEQLSLVNRWGVLTATFSLTGEPRTLQGQDDLILLRVFQEALNNVLAHSKAGKCEVSLWYTPNAARLRISDNGRGFDYERVANSTAMEKGMGLQNIRNRCKMIGAILEIDSQPYRGTTISITYPITNDNVYKK